jgi:hypothetical protein
VKEQFRPPAPSRLASDGRLIVGRLENHGPANYQFRADQSPSYYLKIVTNRGVRVLWGKDLARALAESRTQPKPGSVIGVRRTGYESFTIPERQRDGAGRITETQRLVRRNQWIVESVQFFADRAQLARRVRDAQADARSAVRTHPELMSTYLSLRGARDIAERRIADPKDRERFLVLVREAMAKSIKKGDPLPAVSLRDPPRESVQKTPAARIRKRDESPAR